MTKGERHPSHMVRGWANYTAGFVTEQGMKTGRRKVTDGRYRDGSQRYTWVSDNTPTGYVIVEWQAGDHANRNGTREEAAARSAREMARAAEILTGKGYRVETSVRQNQIGETVLSVWREGPDGQVVR
jgi:hypothetical protein